MSRSTALFWPLQLGGWGIMYLAWLAPVAAKPDLPYLAAERGVSTVLAILLTTALWRGYARLFQPGVSPWLLLSVSAVAAYLGSFVWNLSWAILHNAWIAPAFNAPLDPFTSPRQLGKLLVNSVYNAPLLLAWSLLYFGIRYYRALGDERERALRAQSEAHRAQLQALRYQLNPHFLFNTLNAVSTLVVEKRTREAAGMIARLSDYLRATLEGSAESRVPLDSELDLARRYLEIEQVRFEDRLTVVYDVDPDVLGIPVPVMLLQPLVENAVKHAVAPCEEGGTIHIEAGRADGRLLLRISDDGPGLTAVQTASGLGIGLANTRERLHGTYGDAAQLDLSEAPGGGLCVEISLPARAAVQTKVTT
jgi:two-component system, LytTR family, sensor kinase